MKTTEELYEGVQKAELTWMVMKRDPCMYDAIFQGEHVQLRLNDFPDKPLYTLFVRDREIDIEDAPRTWHFNDR